MDIQTSKIELAKLILNIENPKLIIKIKDMVTNETSDFWLTLSDSEKKEINFGIEQLDNGFRISVNDFLSNVS